MQARLHTHAVKIDTNTSSCTCSCITKLLFNMISNPSPKHALQLDFNTLNNCSEKKKIYCLVFAVAQVARFSWKSHLACCSSVIQHISHMERNSCISFQISLYCIFFTLPNGMENGEEIKVLQGKKMILYKGQGVWSYRILFMFSHSVVCGQIMCICGLDEQLCICVYVFVYK